MNKVMLVGRMGKDPEATTFQSGTNSAKFTLATSKKVKGEQKTEWHNIVCWGKTAEAVSKYCSKGSLVGVTGEIVYRQWDDKQTGQKKYATDINADHVEFIQTEKKAHDPIATYNSSDLDNVPF